MKTIPINIEGFGYPKLIEQAAKGNYKDCIKAFYGNADKKIKFIENIHLRCAIQKINIKAGKEGCEQELQLFSNGDTFIRTDIHQRKPEFKEKFSSYVFKSSDGVSTSVMQGRKGYKAVITGIKGEELTTTVYSSNPNPQYNEIQADNKFFESLREKLQDGWLARNKQIII